MATGKNTESFRTAHKGYYTKSEFKGKLSRTEFIYLMNDFAEHLKEEILNGSTVYLPGKLGVIQVTGKKKIPKLTEEGIKGLSINWKNTNELWEACQECKEKKQLVYNFNEHSDGLSYRFTWSRKSAIFKNKMMFQFIPCRAIKRELATCIKDGKEYLILEGKDQFTMNSKYKLKKRNI